MLIQKNIYPPTNVGQDPDAESSVSVYQYQAGILETELWVK